MAVVSNSFLSCLIDTSFDLDEALTLPDHFGQQIATSSSLQIIADMPTVVNITEDIVCAICMDGFRSSAGGGKKVPCGHLYHEACISSWLANYDSCPLCRSNIISGRE